MMRNALRVNDYFRQKVGVNTIRKVNNSSRPSSIANAHV